MCERAILTCEYAIKMATPLTKGYLLAFLVSLGFSTVESSKDASESF